MADLVYESVSASPAPELCGLVGRYHGYRYVGSDPGVHYGVPSRYLTLIISLGPPIELQPSPGATTEGGVFDALLGGLHTTPAIIRDPGHGLGIRVELSPLGARALLGLPAGALGGHVVNLTDVWGQTASELVDRIAGATPWTTRFQTLDEVLRRVRIDRAEPRREISYAWGRLVGTGGAIKIADLASEIGWSRRHLAEKFTQELGVGVKAAARVLRFERALSLLELKEHHELASIAAECGYYDQAHMAAEWRSISGVSVTEWLAQELRDPCHLPDPPTI